MLENIYQTKKQSLYPKKKQDKTESEQSSIKESVKDAWDKHHETSDRKRLKLEVSVYLWRPVQLLVIKQTINFRPSVFQAAVCDSGVPRKVLPLYESRGGRASFWHCVQAETSRGSRDQNTGPTGDVLLETSL